MARKCDFGVLPFNWRDVGVALYSLGETGFVPAGRVLRCGLVDQQRWEDMGRPLTIINLRPEEDVGPVDRDPSVKIFHKPIDDNADHIAYSTTDPRTSLWINTVLHCVQNASPPILIHCRSGKDRTGVIVAALLTLLHVAPAIIIREYELTPFELRTAQFQDALAGLISNSSWREGLNTDKLRQVCSEPLHPPVDGVSAHQCSIESETKFLTDTLKQVFARANPANVVEELRKARLHNRSVASIHDADEQLALARVLLPMADRLIVVSGSALLGHIIKAASLEHVAFASLYAGNQHEAAEQLHIAAQSWNNVSLIGAVPKLLCEICDEHQTSCEGAIAEDATQFK